MAENDAFELSPETSEVFGQAPEAAIEDKGSQTLGSWEGYSLSTLAVFFDHC